MRIHILSLSLLFLSSCVHSQNDLPVLEAFQKLEETNDGRLGVSALDVKTGKRVDYRNGESFPFCSTFKTLVVAAALSESEKDPTFLERKVPISKAVAEQSGYAPVSGKHAGGTMSVAELSIATIQLSDNAAVNLLIQELGGISAVNTFVREIGDETFRLDRMEPELNSAVPGDPRDTTSPKAMEQSLRRLMLEDMLAPKQRQLLVEWHKGNTTGDKRIRAGVPKGYIVADKTGTCSYGTTNDIGVVWKKNGDPIVLAIYFTQAMKDAKTNDAAVAEAARLVLRELK